MISVVFIMVGLSGPAIFRIMINGGWPFPSGRSTAHQGRVEVKDIQPQGTAFEVLLPLINEVDPLA